MQLGSSNHKGAVAELAIAKEAARLGLGVYMPMIEHGRYDLVLAIGDGLFKTQVKWAQLDGEIVIIRLVCNRHTPRNGYVRTLYTAAEIDLVAAYCGDLDRSYLIPVERIDGRSQIRLRLTPARNNQLAAVNFAVDYEFEGAVAQMARASDWQSEGRRFDSDQLHPETNSIRIGADPFGMHPARFLQRAAAGEEFLITRRGKPMARLLPANGLSSDVRPPQLEASPLDPFHPVALPRGPTQARRDE